MGHLTDRIKSSLPQPVKRLLKPLYHAYLKLKIHLRPLSYQQQMAAEISRFDQEEEVNDLPEIFHYWSNKYLVPMFEKHGFSNPDDFFYKYAAQTALSHTETAQILSIGSGNCDSEVRLAQQLQQNGINNFSITCLDINQTMLDRGKHFSVQQGVDQFLSFETGDFNTWQTDAKYELIIANQCLHHVVKLEHLFASINQALTHNGKFITSDVIGRNGHKRWPEALKEIKKIWKSMPDRYKYNHSMQRFEKKYINHDCSKEGFEGIRAQDVLPLLVKNFDFQLFVPFANLILVFIDRPFGPNFDVNKTQDINFIDAIQKLDQNLIDKGTIKPTQMMAVMGHKNADTRHNNKPQNVIRKPGWLSLF